MPSISKLLRTKRRLIADINRLRLDIATGKQPTAAQILDRLILETIQSTLIPQ